MRINDIKEQTIIDYCTEHNQLEWYAWAVEQPSSRVKKDGKPCKASFFEVRKAFAEKFMPEIIPAKKQRDNFRTRALAAAAAARNGGKK